MKMNDTAVLIRTDRNHDLDLEGYDKAYQKKISMGGRRECRSFCARIVAVENVNSLDDCSGEGRFHGNLM